MLDGGRNSRGFFYMCEKMCLRDSLTQYVPQKMRVNSDIIRESHAEANGSGEYIPAIKPA